MGVQFHFVKPKTTDEEPNSLTAWLNFVQLLESHPQATGVTSKIGSPSKPIMPGSLCFDNMDWLLTKFSWTIDFALPIYTYAYQLTFPNEKTVKYMNRPGYICASDPGPEVVTAGSWFFFAGDKAKKDPSDRNGDQIQD